MARDKKKPNRVQIGVIYWKDATMHGHDQYSTAEVKKLSITSGVAAGLIAHENKKQITLALDYFHKGSHGWRHLTSYPKSGIIKIDRFEQSEYR